MHSLTDADYSAILRYYDKPPPKEKHLLKRRAEAILAKKLCSCIKKVAKPDEEARAIGICTRTVINKKGLKRISFRCKKKRSIVVTKRNAGTIQIGRKSGRKSLVQTRKHKRKHNEV